MPKAFKLPIPVYPGDVVILANGHRKIVNMGDSHHVVFTTHSPRFVNADGSSYDGDPKRRAVGYEPKTPGFKFPAKVKKGDTVILADGQRKVVEKAKDDDGDIVFTTGQPLFLRPNGDSYDGNAAHRAVGYEPKAPKAKKPKAFKLPANVKAGDVIILADGKRRTVLHPKDSTGDVSFVEAAPGFMNRDGSSWYADHPEWHAVGIERAAKKAAATPPTPPTVPIPADFKVGDTVILADGQKKKISHSIVSPGGVITVEGTVPGWVMADGSTAYSSHPEWRAVGFERKVVKFELKAGQVYRNSTGHIYIVTDTRSLMRNDGTVYGDGGGMEGLDKFFTYLGMAKEFQVK